jgi:hypothetical protein
MVEQLRPIQERYRRMISEPQIIVNMLHEGAKKARHIASQTFALVYERVGLLAW